MKKIETKPRCAGPVCYGHPSGFRSSDEEVAAALAAPLVVAVVYATGDNERCRATVLSLVRQTHPKLMIRVCFDAPVREPTMDDAVAWVHDRDGSAKMPGHELHASLDALPGRCLTVEKGCWSSAVHYVMCGFEGRKKTIGHGIDVGYRWLDSATSPRFLFLSEGMELSPGDVEEGLREARFYTRDGAAAFVEGLP